MKKRILVVEDDAALARVLKDNLVFEGFDVESVNDGSLVLEKAKSFAPDLVVLDIMLPGADGFELCSTLRQRGRTPILILTARSQKADKLLGLNLGADDYITKPFDLEEFLARVKAVLRRARPATDKLTMGAVIIDFASQTARRGNSSCCSIWRSARGMSCSAKSCCANCGAIRRFRSRDRSTMPSRGSGKKSSPTCTIRDSSTPCTATDTRSRPRVSPPSRIRNRRGSN